jgi:hypothetical protein
MPKFITSIFSILVFLFGQVVFAQYKTCTLVLLDVRDVKEAAVCYTTKCDGKKVPMTYAFDDSINHIDDLSVGEDIIPAADCFVPELKIIFEGYTYVVSMYCSNIVMYKNSAPGVPSSTRLKCDIQMTPSVLKYFRKLIKVNFNGVMGSKVLREKTVLNMPLPDPEQEQKDPGDDAN